MDKIGHWKVIEIVKDFEIKFNEDGKVIQCDKCNFIHTIPITSHDYNFCPKCGLKMI